MVDSRRIQVNYFRNLFVLDEWLDQRPPVLAKVWEELTPQEKEEADRWIVDQFKKKNSVLRNQREGIFVLDRGPLDPLSFTPDAEWNAKAGRLLDTICPGMAQWQVEDGRVILLRGEWSELSLRMVLTQRKDYTADKLKDMEDRLTRAYGSDGVTTFDTRGLTPPEVARRVAEIIHLEPYTPTCDLHNRLQNIRREGFHGAE